MLAFMNGYKTYSGLAITLLAVLGATKYISPEEMEQVVELVVALVGIALAVYGRSQAGK